MTDVRRADPAARRQAVLFVVVGTFVGALLIVAFERYRIPLRDWVVAEGASAQRVEVVFLLLAVLLLVPLLAFAAYLWSLGEGFSERESFHPRGFAFFAILRSSPARRQYPEDVSSKGSRLGAVSLPLHWVFYSGDLRRLSVAMRASRSR